MTRLLRKLHRDLGFLTVALTVIFSVSGIALNHVDDWNPNYVVEQSTSPFKHNIEKMSDKELGELVISELEISLPLKAVFWESPTTTKLFFKKDLTVIIDLEKGVATKQQVSKRKVLYYFNALHLNNIKNGWVYISDIFAVILIFLAISGMFIVKGKKGLKGRGGILTLIGIAIPLIYIFINLGVNLGRH